MRVTATAGARKERARRVARKSLCHAKPAAKGSSSRVGGFYGMEVAEQVHA